MSETNQNKIIQEQIEANQRIIKAVEKEQPRAVKGQAPVNERIKQIGPNERTETKPQTPPKPEEKTK